LAAAAADGLERPEEGAEGVLPPSEGFCVFSMALAAVALAPAAAVAGAGVSFLDSSFFAAGAGFPILRTLAFGFGASPPMLSTFGAPAFRVTGLLSSAAPGVPSAGRLAIVGVARGCWA